MSSNRPQTIMLLSPQSSFTTPKLTNHKTHNNQSHREEPATRAFQFRQELTPVFTQTHHRGEPSPPPSPCSSQDTPTRPHSFTGAAINEEKTRIGPDRNRESAQAAAPCPLLPIIHLCSLHVGPPLTQSSCAAAKLHLPAEENVEKERTKE